MYLCSCMEPQRVERVTRWREARAALTQASSRSWRIICSQFLMRKDTRTGPIASRRGLNMSKSLTRKSMTSYNRVVVTHSTETASGCTNGKALRYKESSGCLCPLLNTSRSFSVEGQQTKQPDQMNSVQCAIKLLSSFRLSSLRMCRTIKQVKIKSLSAG